MIRQTLFAALLTGLALPACVAGTDEPVSDDRVGEVTHELQGGKWCTSTAGCPSHQYCTTEDGDCLQPPSCKNKPCLAVCYGRCINDDREACGDVLCPSGQVCCNDSCGICTEPGGVCTQEVCATL